MFLLVPLALGLLEVFVFIELGLAIGWLLTIALLVGISLLGVPLLRIQGRLAIERVAVAMSERRPPGRAAIDGALGFLGSLLLVIPGFITDALGVLLLLAPTRALVRRWISRRYARRVMRFAAAAARFTSGERAPRPADVESTAVEEDHDQLGR